MSEIVKVRRAWKLGLAGVVAASLLFGVIWWASVGTATAQPEIFAQPQVAADEVPAYVISLFQDVEALDVDSSRVLANTPGGSSYWLLLSTQGKRVCLVGELPSGVKGMSCGSLDQYYSGDIRLAIVEGQGLVEDGYVEPGTLRTEAVIALPTSLGFAEPSVGDRITDIIFVGGLTAEVEQAAADLMADELKVRD